MKRTYLIAIFILTLNGATYSNESETLIQLSKIYNKFHAITELNQDSEDILSKYQDTEYGYLSVVIKEICTPKNNIFSHKYLSKPDTLTLKRFHIIILLNYNLFNPNGQDSYELVEKLIKEDLNYYESLRFYYSSIFVSIRNKNKGFDYSNIDLDLDELNLKSDTEKGIFMLELTESLGFQAVSYIKYAQSPRYEKSYEYLKTFPTINSMPYYKYTYFGFPDIQMLLNRKVQSFKDYYLAKYFEVLKYHYICLTEVGTEEERYDLLLSSILSNPQYHPYCQDKKFLKKILKRQK